MYRRAFLSGCARTALVSSAAVRAAAMFQARGPVPDESLAGQPVNLLRYGEIQSWVTPRSTPALRAALLRGDGIVPENLAPGSPEFDIGVEWAEFRTISSIAVRFRGAVPPPAARVLETWEGLTPLQGTWKPVQPEPDDRIEDNLWRVTLRRRGSAAPLRTCRVRLRLRSDTGGVESMEAYGPSIWKAGTVRVELGHGVGDRLYDGRVESYNGEAVSVEPFGGFAAAGPGAWTGRAGNGVVAGIAIRALYTSGMDVDRTILTLRTKSGDFSFLPREAIEEQPVDVPDFGAFIRDHARNITRAGYRRANSERFRIVDAAGRMPEQTLEQAFARIDADRVVAFVGVDSNSQKFGIAPAGHVIVGYGEPQGGRAITPRFNIYFDHSESAGVFAAADPAVLFQHSADKSQRLDEGWLPVITTAWGSKNDVTYERTDFAVLRDHSGVADQARLGGDEPSVMLSRLRIRNDSPVAKTVSWYIRAWKPAKGGVPYGLPPAGVENAWRIMVADGCVQVLEDGAAYGVCFVDTRGRGALEEVLSGSAARYSVALAPAHEHTIQFAIAGRPTPAGEIVRLKNIDYEAARQATASYWRARLAEGSQFELPDRHIQNLYNANLQHFLVTATKDPKRGELYAHTAAFHYGTIGSESTPIIEAFDMRGMHEHARRALQAFLSTQGDAVPDGEYASQEGGFYHYWPWYGINQGFVLWGLAQHYLYTGDRAWLRTVAPRIVAGCDFVIRSRQVTRKELPGGGRPIYYGFAPATTIGDPRSWKYSFMVSGFFYLGLKKCARVLEDVDPENAARITAEAADFLKEIRRGLKEATARSPVVRLRDNTSVPGIPPFVTSRGFTSDVKDNVDPDPRFSYASDCLVGAMQLVKCEVLGPNDPETTWMLNILEDRFFMYSQHERARIRLENISSDWLNLGGFDKMQPYYLHYQEAYLERDQVELFLRGFFNTLAGIADKQNLSFQEEFGGTGGQPQKTHEEARFLRQLRIMLVMEMERALFLARGTPRAWLEDGKTIAVTRAPTYFGPVSYRIRSFVNRGRIECSVDPPSRGQPAGVYLRLRHPAHARLQGVRVNGARWKDFDAAKEWIRLPRGAGHVEVIAEY